MVYEFESRRLVEFADTDMAGILHFANYFRYMEAVEHEFFRSLGLSVHSHDDSGVWGWVRGSVECSYRRPLRYEDVVALHLLVAEKRAKSITYQIRFRHQGPDDAAPVEVARGGLTAICVAKVPGEDRIRAIEMPAEVDRRIEVAPAAMLA